jgi:hypothetical protein
LGGFFQAIELNIDSEVLVKAISSHGHGSLRGKTLVEKNKRLLELDREVVVKHSYCEVNI